jgi:hypothetical protein
MLLTQWRLAFAVRLALASSELLEDQALVLGQLLAHRRQQQRAPRLPAIAVEHAAEQRGI